jgi:hypothetical protein
MLASRLGDPRSPRRATLTLRGIHSATLEMMVWTVIAPWLLFARSWTEVALHGEALRGSESCYPD